MSSKTFKHTIPNLLVIDDDEIIWVLIKDMLHELELVDQMQTFSDGDTALHYLSELTQGEAPPLIVLDLNLPYLDGFEFLEIYARDLWMRFPQTVIYILTTSVRESDRQQTLKYPFVKDFISKPMKLEQLKAMLDPYVRS
ncbi:MAG: hypothetical protein CVV27_13155 [Candidatus Melainabacteria bacterium HGW-Melainabacteria-1]|nr:MAG: hypothetical protein CVV27_13155 [Candidatus Melainabacteria bacterium HGW-Melainabacteria-1]